MDQVGPLNRTALHESAFLGLDNFVYLLLESGANPNACDTKQKTPLALAAQNGHLNIVEILVEKGIWEKLNYGFGNPVSQVICINSVSQVICIT